MVSLLTAFLASKWRWVAFALAIIFAVLLLTQASDYASTWWAHRRLAKATKATVRAHTTRAAGEARHRSNFDSAFYSQAGQRRELARTLAKIKHLDDSLHHRLPAAPALPAVPPRP